MFSSPITHPWRRTGERMYSSYSFTTSALDGGEWSAVSVMPRSPFTPGTYWTGGWVGLSASLVTEATGKTLCLCRGSNLDRAVSWDREFINNNGIPNRCYCNS
jgi:hypothetical protein